MKLYVLERGAQATVRDLRHPHTFNKVSLPKQTSFAENEMDHMTFDNGQASYVFVRGTSKYIVAQRDVKVVKD